MTALLALFLLAQQGIPNQVVSPVTRPTTSAVNVQVDPAHPIKVDIGGTSVSATTTCHATTGAPTYVNGTDNPLSCDLAGTLRTSAGGGGGGSVTQGTTPWAVSLMNSGTTGVVMLNAVNATGASATYTNANGYTAHVLHVVATGTPNIVIRLEGSYDNSNWNILSTVTQASASLNDLVASGWYPYLRANLNTFSGGSSPTLTAVYHGIDASIASTQLPAALDANGNLKVHEQQTNPQLPTNLSAGVNLRTTMQDWGSGGSAGGAAFTSATVLDSTSAVTSSGIAYAAALISVNVSGSITSGSLNIECSNDAGTTYFACAGARVSSGTTDTVIPLNAITKELWRVPFAGMSGFRVRLNPVITGAGTATVAVALSAVPYDAVVSAASLPLPAGASTEATLALIKTDVDKIPTSPSTDRTTAAAPFSAQLSDGAAFYAAAKTGQFPAALDGSGFLKTHEQGTATVSGTVGATQSGTWTVQPGNTANTTAWKVDGSAVTQPVSGTVGATQSGTWTVQPGNTPNTTAWKVDGSAVTQPVSGTLGATQSGTWTVQPGNTANTTPWLASNNDGTNTQKVLAASTAPAATDKAAVVAISPTPAPVCTGVISVSQTASTDVHTATGKTYICSIVLVSDTAQFVNVIEGTGATCATGGAALLGSTTAGNGMSFAANGGISSISSSPWLPMQTTNDHLCVTQSGAGRLSGTITYKDF